MCSGDSLGLLSRTQDDVSHEFEQAKGTKGYSTRGELISC